MTTTPPPPYNPDPSITGSNLNHTPAPAYATLATPAAPTGLALVGAIPANLDPNVVYQCFVELVQAISATPAGTKLTFHWPPPMTGCHWAQFPDNQSAHWWTGLPLPFNCYSRADMEHFVDVLASETDAAPKLRVVTYQMTVSAISANGLRLKVFDNPPMWVLGAQTQAVPS